MCIWAVYSWSGLGRPSTDDGNVPEDLARVPNCALRVLGRFSPLIKVPLMMVPRQTLLLLQAWRLLLLRAGHGAAAQRSGKAALRRAVVQAAGGRKRKLGFGSRGYLHES